MLFNQTVAWRPAPFAPIAGGRARVLAQAVPAGSAATPSASPSAVKAIALTIAIAMAGATAWVGLDVGARRSGLLSVLGYIVGVGGVLSGAVDLVSLAGLGYGAIKGPATVPGPTLVANTPLA